MVIGGRSFKKAFCCGWQVRMTDAWGVQGAQICHLKQDMGVSLHKKVYSDVPTPLYT